MPTPNETIHALATLDVNADRLSVEIIEIISRNDRQHWQAEIAAHLAFVDCLREVSK